MTGASALAATPVPKISPSASPLSGSSATQMQGARPFQEEERYRAERRKQSEAAAKKMKQAAGIAEPRPRES